MALSTPTLGVGLHLNIVRGTPLSAPDKVPLLTGADGRFRSFRLARLSPAFLTQAEREYRRQFEKFLAAGPRPTHIDFEKHHAWQAPLYSLACRLAAEYGVTAVRNLREPVAWAIRAMGWPGAGKAAMAAMLRCGISLGLAKPAGIARPARLLGQAHIGAMDESAWLKLLEKLPSGISEVMTHPGEREGSTSDNGPMGASWMDDARERELTALVSPRVGEAVRRRSIRLLAFFGLPRG